MRTIGAVALGALLLTSCSSSTSPDADQHVVATIGGTWDTSALGGALSLTLSQGTLDGSTNAAPVTGTGTYGQSTFAVSGSVSGKGGTSSKDLTNVALSWTMAYGSTSTAQFQFGGGLEEVTPAGSHMVGFLNSPNGGVVSRSTTFTKR